MIKTAINWWKFGFICLIFSAAIFVSSTPIFATQYQQCATNSTCSIGEFLYDDNYQTISVGTTCSLTSRYPNGDILLNAVTMDVSADGYYSYAVGTSGLNNGVYRTQMCCLTGTENICLDKTFEIAATSNSLVADIWAYPDRALTSFGTLISSIWSAPTRQLTSGNLDNGTSLATTENINTIGSSLAVISAQVSVVQTDVTSVNSKVDALTTTVNTIQTTTNNILAKWSTYNILDILNYVDSIEVQMGNNTQTCSDNSIFGQIKCIQDKWGTESAATIYAAANNAYATATSIRSELNFNGKSTTAYDEMIALKSYVDTIESSIGSESDTSASASIFGRVKQVREAVDAIDNSTLDLNDLLAKWGDYSATDIYDKVKNLSSDISGLNNVSNVTTILNTNTTNITEIKNQVLAMRAILSVNKTMLESLSNRPIIKTWLEDGSIIFKHLITNPSKFFDQDVPFTYYFPPEVKENNIIKKSDSLEIKYDASKSVYYASGNFKLKPNDSIIVDIEVEDIWTIPLEKINSLKKQADELFTPLKNTSYFAQGTTLHSDIFASLDRIVALQKTVKLPEDKIKVYNETKIEMESINRKLESLKTIVTSAGSVGTLSGFIGGIQTMAVWGIIVIMVAGFVLLGLYIRSLNPPQNKPPQSIMPKIPLSLPPRMGYMSIIALTVITSASGSIYLTNYIYKISETAKSNPAVLSATTTYIPVPSPKIPTPTSVPTPKYIIPSPTSSPTAIPTIILPISTTTIPTTFIPTSKVFIRVPDRDTVYLYSKPSYDASVTYKIPITQEAELLVESKRWAKVILSKLNIEGWVSQDFIEKNIR